METSEDSGTSPVATNLEADMATWDVIVARIRIDAFNQTALLKAIEHIRSRGQQKIALDLRATRFISFSAIQFLVQFAKTLKEAGGQLALIAPTEKSRRHFEIYGSLKNIQVFRAGQSLKIGERVELGISESQKSNFSEIPLTAAMQAIIADSGVDEAPLSEDSLPEKKAAGSGS